MFYVYVLKSMKDSRYYIGQTNNVLARLKIHNLGKVLSTKARKPFTLVGYQSYKTRNEARWVEYNLKNHSDKKKQFIKLLETQRPPAAQVFD